jgi:DNA-binding NarL/FixJ family response regulator
VAAAACQTISRASCRWRSNTLHAAAEDFEKLDMRHALPAAQRRLDAVAAAANRLMVMPGELTARECEVAALLGAGISNRCIAHLPGMSEATVGVHVKHILSKLGFTSRAQAAVWSEHGLVRAS